MFVVHFFENKNELLNQMVKRVPSVGEELLIKGRKGKISSIMNIDQNKIHVQVTLETVNKNKLTEDTTKKKKR